MKVGFCGTGRMGAAMAGRLIAAGHHVKVWNRSADKLAPLVAAGATLASSPAEAAGGADILLMCLFDSAAVEEVVFGASGVVIAHNVAPLLVDHSSIAPEPTRDFAVRLRKACGSCWIDAPVSGGVMGAASGTLTVMAGGPESAIISAREAIKSYAACVIRAGDVGAGQSAKLCNQNIVAATLVAIAEAVILARNSGIDPARLTELLGGGWADSALLRIFVPRMTAPDGSSIGTLSTMLKDIDNVRMAAHATGTSLPVGSAVHRTLTAAETLGLGGLDLGQIVEILRVWKPE
jgi:2-hydroxy-3-oxopropionate reductase